MSFGSLCSSPFTWWDFVYDNKGVFTIRLELESSSTRRMRVGVNCLFHCLSFVCVAKNFLACARIVPFQRSRDVSAQLPGRWLSLQRTYGATSAAVIDCSRNAFA